MGNLSTAHTFLKNGWNDDQILKTKPLFSEHFIPDTIL